MSNEQEEFLEEIKKLDFAFISYKELRYEIKNYWSQAYNAFTAKSYLGTLVACGAVLEGLLTLILIEHRDKAEKSNKACKNKENKVKPIQEWNLNNLINVSAELQLIGPAAKQASWAVKDFRNLIHPYNLLKSSSRPDLALSLNALSAVMEITRSLKGRIKSEN